jgi:hypothetical protein
VVFQKYNIPNFSDLYPLDNQHISNINNGFHSTR